jgi:hypothetical protein
MLKKYLVGPEMMAYTYNPRTQEVEADAWAI